MIRGGDPGPNGVHPAAAAAAQHCIAVIKSSGSYSIHDLDLVLFTVTLTCTSTQKDIDLHWCTGCSGPSDNSILYMMVLLRELLPALPKVDFDNSL